MPSLKELQDTVDSVGQAAQWLAKTWSQGGWFRRLTLIEAILIVAANPEVIKKVAPGVEKNVSSWYPYAYWAVIGALFLVLIVLAARSSGRGSTGEAPPELKPLKGLRPFEMGDKDIFAKLQRQEVLWIWLPAIQAGEFRFGIIQGESGSGKSSFVQAGLHPQLETDAVLCVYVKFSDTDPFDSLREAILRDFRRTGVTLSEAAKHQIEKEPPEKLFASTAKLAGKAVVFLFDQFEQFFVQNKMETARQPFIELLAGWYKERPAPSVKIIICLREDFVGRLEELQREMGYTLGPQQNMRLEKFRPEQAAMICKVIAEAASVGFDEPFIQRITRDELADKDDGLVSPVNIQILSLMLLAQGEGANFNEITFRTLGGVDGLLEQYVKKALDARETDGRRQAAIKVLLALTNLDDGTRAGSLSLDELKEKLKDTLSETELREAAGWLVRSDVRLTTAEDRGGVARYELAHERLIPALRKIAGKELTGLDRANRLLNERANLRQGDAPRWRYMLTYRELRLVKRYAPQITWGVLKAQKQDIVARSWRLWLLKSGLSSVVVVIALGVSVWLNSPAGLSFQARRELYRLIRRLDRDGSALITIANTFAQAGDTDQALELLKQALKATEGMSEASKSQVLSRIASSVSNLKDTRQAVDMLKQALKATEGMNEYYKSRVLSRIASSISNLKDTDQALELLKQVRSATEGMSEYEKSRVLSSIANSASNLKDTDQALELLRQALKATEEWGKSDENVALSYANMGDWSDAYEVAWGISNDAEKAETLAEVLEIQKYGKQEKKPSSIGAH